MLKVREQTYQLANVKAKNYTLISDLNVVSFVVCAVCTDHINLTFHEFKFVTCFPYQLSVQAATIKFKGQMSPILHQKQK